GAALAPVNREIYNHRQLRAELEERGCSFRSRSDAEVVPHLYRAHGSRFVERLDGMFALAVLDLAQGKLLLARDRLGKKPLYWRERDGVVEFASEAQALVAGERVEPDPGALLRFLAFGHVPEGGSAFAGLRRLPPGHLLVAGADGVRVERWWSPPPVRPEERGIEEWKEEARERLVLATRARLEADAPLGLFLSGGIDSGLVLAAASLAGAAPLRAFTVGFADPAFDERGQAARSAARFGAEHVVLLASPAPERTLAEIAACYDEPFGDSSAYPTLLLCRLARQHVKVALSGDGGDESFAGYRRHAALGLSSALARACPAPLRRLLARLLGEPGNGVAGRAGAGELRRLLAALDLPAAERHLYWTTFFRAPLRTRFLHPDLLAAALAADPEGEALALFHAQPGSTLRKALASDLERYLPGDLLVKVDMASMSCGLEVRSPFLDLRLVELGRALPDRLLARGRRTKILLRELARELLPPEVANGRKRGFGVPLAQWLRGPLAGMASRLLASPRFAARRILRPGAARELLDRHMSGSEDWSAYLWLLLMLEAWLRRFVDREDVASWS
ncbi:MAG: asparagine synthase (glutamine-hydrolyzing), partial [Planctomycetes bacterium]|nr:asparagine synthase (glutamine-hydrolyzing) [Planctomycetota bacterium]